MSSSDTGLIALGVIEMIGVFGGTWLFMKRYAHPKMEWLHYITVFLAYFLGFGGTVFLAVDIALTDEYRDTKQEDSPSMKVIWTTSYWLTWVIAWVIVPILQEYWSAGQFTAREKLRASIKANLRAIAVGVGVMILILIWVSIKSENPGAVLMALSNFYALILIVLLLAYGMVEVPRSFWRSSSPEKQLRHIEFRASDVDMRLYDAEESLKEVMKTVSRFEIAMKRETDSTLQRYWSLVMENVVPSDSTSTGATSSNNNITSHHINSNQPVWQLDDPIQWKVEKLANINADLRMARVRVRRAEAEWRYVLNRSEELESVINRVSQPSGTNAAAAMGESNLTVTLRAWRWYWILHIAPIFNKIMCVLTALMSLALLWCEATIPLSQRLSIVGELIQNSNSGNVVGVQILVLIPLSYATWCTYSSLVKLKIPFIDALRLQDNAQTDAYVNMCVLYTTHHFLFPSYLKSLTLSIDTRYALLFNAGYVSRLQFGLGANFLMLLQYDDSTEMWPTSFRDVVGKMNVDFLGDSFVYVFPVSMLGIVLLLYFRIYDRMLMILGVDLYIGMGEPLNQDKEYQDRLKEGQMLIRNGRRKRDRGRRRLQSSNTNNANRNQSESYKSRRGSSSSSKSGRLGAARGRYEQLMADGGV